MTKQYWGVCSNDKCGKWGAAPINFKERFHFLKCSCGELMYLTILNPSEAGYRESDKTTVTVVNQ